MSSRRVGRATRGRPERADRGRQGRPAVPRRDALVLAGALGAALLVVGAAVVLDARPDLPDVAPDPSADLTASQRERARQLQADLAGPRWAALVLTVLGAVVAALVLARPVVRLGGAVAARLRLPDVLRRAVQAAAAGAVVVVGSALAALPVRARAHEVLVDVGLDVRGTGLWLTDVARVTAVEAAGTALVVAVGWALLGGHLRPRVRLVAAVLVAAVSVGVGSAVWPLVVEPATRSVVELPDGPARDDVVDLADRAGVEVERVVVADTSRRRTSVNAQVSGIGPTREVELADTLLDLPREQVRAVVAHELAHVEARDVEVGSVLGALGAASGVALLLVVADSGPVRRVTRTSGLRDPAAAGVLVALVAVTSPLVAPAAGYVSRAVEARADVRSLELTRDPAAVAEVQRSLAVRNVGALEAGWDDVLLGRSHPVVPQRLAATRAWAAAEGLAVPPPLAREQP